MNSQVVDGRCRSWSAVRIDHELGTRNVLVQVFSRKTGRALRCDIERTDDNYLTARFGLSAEGVEFRCLIVALDEPADGATPRF